MSGVLVGFAVERICSQSKGGYNFNTTLSIVPIVCVRVYV